MATFPELTQGPDVERFSQEKVFDPTLRTDFESGHRLTRNRCTVVPLLFKLFFSYLTASDKSLLEVFEKDTVGYGGDSFWWENTENGISYDVRFAKPIGFELNPIDSSVPAKRYRAGIELEQASTDLAVIIYTTLNIGDNWRFTVVADELQLQKKVDDTWTFVHSWSGSGTGTGNWRLRKTGDYLVIEKETSTEWVWCGDYSSSTGSSAAAGSDNLNIYDSPIDGSWRFSVVGENMELQVKIDGNWEVNTQWQIA